MKRQNKTDRDSSGPATNNVILSVEETNRLREKLGLRPLRPKNAVPFDESHARETVKPTLSTYPLPETSSRSNNRNSMSPGPSSPSSKVPTRRKNAFHAPIARTNAKLDHACDPGFTNGSTIGQQEEKRQGDLDDPSATPPTSILQDGMDVEENSRPEMDEPSITRAWLHRVRNTVVTDPTLAEKAPHSALDQEVSSDHLGPHAHGLTEPNTASSTVHVRHTQLHDLKIAEGTILTLADENVLDDSGNQMNDAVDVLENPQDREVANALRNNRLRSLKTVSMYNPVDDAQFQDSTKPHRPAVLSKYDDEDEEDATPVSLDHKGQGTVQAQVSPTDAALVKNPVAAMPPKRDAADLQGQDIDGATIPKAEFESAYYTKEEYRAKFNRRSSSTTGSNGSRRVKKRRRSVMDEEPSPISGVVSTSAVATRQPDSAQRKSTSSRVLQLRAEAVQRLQDVVDEDENDENSEISLAIARARRAASIAREQKPGHGLQSLIRSCANSGVEYSKEIEDGSGEGRGGDLNDVVVTEVEQFIETGGRLNDVSEVRESKTNITNHGVDNSEPLAPSDSAGHHFPDSIDTLHETPGRESAGRVQDGELEDRYAEDRGNEDKTSEPMGVAYALSRFRAIGALQNSRSQQGRAKDKRFDWSEAKIGRDVSLVYTDDQGHEVTQKEAFRILSHKFHGKGPGQNKKETRLKRLLQSREIDMKMFTGDTPLGSAAALREETRKTGSAHVLLSGRAAIANSSGPSPAEGRISSVDMSTRDRHQGNHSISNQDNTHQQSMVGPEEKVEFSLGSVNTGSQKRSRRH